jgi:hypothetical protein
MDTDALLLKAASALRDMSTEFRGHDLPYGSKAYTDAQAVFSEIAKHFGVTSVDLTIALPKDWKSSNDN